MLVGGTRFASHALGWRRAQATQGHPCRIKLLRVGALAGRRRDAELYALFAHSDVWFVSGNCHVPTCCVSECNHVLCVRGVASASQIHWLWRES